MPAISEGDRVRATKKDDGEFDGVVTRIGAEVDGSHARVMVAIRTDDGDVVEMPVSYVTRNLSRE